ncbi:alpha/beta hydrolase [Halioxenophilus sp. WMMB6]|uniref:alpha/beta hydrolase n=1 Tax=Halioxenophilus sp. WMMB6 TaxID=3073815 RepID=UPI00295E380A|nr:alpha/beta fold hydrolase [Halioxenophilus sp. WMMB6]
MAPHREISTHRAYALVNGRRVHYRRWGSGPAILALHGSPQSSRCMEAIGRRLATAGFCVIAPDTPGNGLSSPLTVTDATTADFAEALLELADELQLGRFGVYGFHTGATIACALAARHPERVSALACDGLPDWSDAERQLLLEGYLPRFEPNWDGSHLCWLWARVEEQTVFFPWHMAKPEYRMHYDVSPMPHLHGNALDFLESGDNYRMPYHAAFTFKAGDWLSALTTPHLFAAMELDPLAAHLQRPGFNGVATRAFSTPEAMHLAFISLFNEQPGDPAPAPIYPRADAFGLSRGWVGEDRRALAWVGNLTTASVQRPLVLLHGAGGSQRSFSDCLAELTKQRPAIAVELPGHGDSDRRQDDAPSSVAAIGREIALACQRLGLTEYDVAGLHLGGQVAAWLVNEGHAVTGASLGLSAVDAAERDDWASNYAPSLEPEFDGAQLVRAFRIARWERLFYPWFKRNRSYLVELSSDLQPADVHRRAVELLRAGPCWQGAVTAEAEFDLISQSPPPAKFKLFAVDGDPRSTAAQMGRLQYPVARLSEQSSHWAKPLAALGYPLK